MCDLVVSWRHCSYRLRRFFTEPRAMLVLMLLVLFAVVYAAPVADCATYIGAANGFGILPAVLCDPFSQLLLMLGVLLLVGDAPFLDSSSTYLLLRSSPGSWALGQVLYILVLTAMYVVFATLLCWLVMMPNVQFTVDWGKAWNSLAYMGPPYEALVPRPSVHLVTYYTAPEAFCFSLLLAWLGGAFMGLLQFALSLLRGARFGLVVAGLVAMFPLTIHYSLYVTWYHYFSPLSLANMGFIDRLAVTAYPSLSYALTALPLFCLASVAIALLTVRLRPSTLNQIM